MEGEKNDEWPRGRIGICAKLGGKQEHQQGWQPEGIWNQWFKVLIALKDFWSGGIRINDKDREEVVFREDDA